MSKGRNKAVKNNTNKNTKNNQNKKMKNKALANAAEIEFHEDESEKVSILNPDVSLKSRIVLGIVGFITILIGFRLYRANIHIYDFHGAHWLESLYNIEYDKVPLVLNAQCMILAGVTFLLINFKYVAIKRFVYVALAPVIGFCIIHAPSLWALIVLILFLVAFSIMILFITEVATAMSFFAFLVVSLGIIEYVRSNFQLGTNADKLSYIIFSCSMLVFILIGRKISQFLISAFDSKSTADAYDQKLFKNHIFMLYLIVFVIINIIPMESKNWDLINNSFLTGIAIIQVDWTKIGPRKKREATNVAEEEKQDENGGMAPLLKASEE